MVIEKNVEDKTKVNYIIIHYMCILPKWRHKGYGKYLMDKAFASDAELENVKFYIVTRLVHDYTPSNYVKPGRKYIEQEVCVQIIQDTKDEHKNQTICVPNFFK